MLQWINMKKKELVIVEKHLKEKGPY